MTIEIKFNITETDEYSILHFDLDDAIVPQDLQYIKFKLPVLNGTKGVVLSGRGPIWLYCFLAHHYHPTKFVATYDPRLGGAVVVETHTPEYKEGEIIRMEVRR